MLLALLLASAFALGWAARTPIQRHYDRIFRAQFAGGVGTLALLAGWSFEGGVSALTGLGLLLAAQTAAVFLAAFLFRTHREGPLLAFGMYGNPTFWALPVAAATLGPAAAVVVAAYDTLFQPRIALGIRLLRRRAPVPQSPRTALTDYAPMAGALAGVALGRVVTAPAEVAEVVSALGVVLAASGGVLIGAAWPRERWAGGRELWLGLRAMALHVTFVPAVLLAAALAGLSVPPAMWVLALGPLPIATLTLARLYGYSTRVAASVLAVSLPTAVLLLPVAIWLARHAQDLAL